MFPREPSLLLVCPWPPALPSTAPATSARLLGPVGVALDASGTLFLAEESTQRIRRVAGVAAAARLRLVEPAEGGQLSRGASTPVAFAWTPVAGAAESACPRRDGPSASSATR